jgi:PPM family protein phosphatase
MSHAPMARWGGELVTMARWSSASIGKGNTLLAMAMDKFDVEIPGFEAMEGVELVQKLPLFRTLTFDETRALFAIARLVKKGKGDVVIEEDSLGSALYILRKGTVRIERRGALLGTRGVGELLGEMSLVDDVLTSAEVVADEDVELLMIPRRDFETLLERDPSLALKVYKAFCRTLSERLRTTNDIKGGVH